MTIGPDPRIILEEEHRATFIEVVNWVRGDCLDAINEGEDEAAPDLLARVEAMAEAAGLKLETQEEAMHRAISRGSGFGW